MRIIFGCLQLIGVMARTGAAGLWALPALQAPGAEGPDYLMEVRGVEQGLPQHVVSSVQQTTAGDLWCGTFNGLARFDGVRFEVFDEHSDPPLPGRGVTALYEDRGGKLWVGLDSGGTARVEGRLPQAFPDAPCRPGTATVAFGEDGAGDLWVLWRDGGLMRMRDRMTLSPGAGIDVSEAELGLAGEGPGGPLWLVHRGGLAEVTPDGLVPAETGIGQFGGHIFRAAASRRGGVWIVGDGRLRRWQKGRWAEDLGVPPWDHDAPDGVWFVSALRELADGRLMAGLVGGGVTLGRPGGAFVRYDRRRGLPQQWVRCVTEDREGNLWAGTGGGGLVAMRRARVRMLTLEPDDSRHDVKSLFPSVDGTVWAATEGGGLHRVTAGAAQQVKLTEHPSSLYVWSVAEYPPGQVWAGTWGAGLLVRGAGEAGFVPAPGWPESAGAVMVLHPDPARGCLWAGGAGELGRLGPQGWEFRDGENRTWAPPGQRSMADDGEGGLWIGLGDGRLVHRRGEELRIYGEESGLRRDAISALIPLPDGTVWLGTVGGGLVRFRNGATAAVTRAHGLPDNAVSQLLTEGKEWLWAGTYRGICRLSFAELDACADRTQARVNPLVLGRADGMSSLECTSGGQPGACRDADGGLLFRTNHGIARVDPAGIRLNPLPPPVVIESLRADDREVPASGGLSAPAMVLGPGVTGVTLNYTALSLTAPDRVRFRTRLEGLEPDWQDAAGQRDMVYRYLPPGRYVFHVTACNNDGVWNPEGARLAFEIRPYFWQTGWFLAVGGLASAGAAGSLVWWGARRRSAARLEIVERAHAVERERARIARDIHDDLGSGLTRIAHLSRAARAGIPEGSPAAGEIDGICQAAGRLTSAMDEIVWAVDPRHDSLDSLVGYAVSAAQEILKAAQIRFRLEAPDELPAWVLPAECRHNLFLAFKEALHNAARHSGATTAHVRFGTDPGGFTVSIEDDGCGFHPEDRAERAGGGGRGLPNMQARLLEIGGTCTVRSAPGHGTRIDFRVPAVAVMVS